MLLVNVIQSLVVSSKFDFLPGFLLCCFNHSHSFPSNFEVVLNFLFFQRGGNLTPFLQSLKIVVPILQSMCELGQQYALRGYVQEVLGITAFQKMFCPILEVDTRDKILQTAMVMQ